MNSLMEVPRTRPACGRPRVGDEAALFRNMALLNLSVFFQA